MRSFLDKTYEVIEGPAQLAWDAYVSSTTERWEQLLDSDPSEVEVQHFLERNPGLLPGHRSMTITSGHSPFPPGVITQPPLAGLTKKVPDFMWISTASDSIFPVLIEIERPGKRWFKADGDTTADLNHARQQLATWRAWFRRPVNQQWFLEYYELTGFPWDRRALRPAYVLIHGRRAEFDDKPELNRLRSDLEGEDEFFMTFDRLGLDSWSQDYVTCRKSSPHGYEVVAVPPTIAWGPRHIHDYARMRGWTAAIEQCDLMPNERKRFLLARQEYWMDWVRGGLACVTRGERE